MARGPYGSVIEQFHRLFQGASMAGLSEWQLLNRYVTRRDESAFEALVARHGPMVLGVCRGMLTDPHAVEDAFQATFLVLVRRAGSLGEHDAIGHWLYGVARRVALRARSETARKHAWEKPISGVDPAGGGTDPDHFELAARLHEELTRLPAVYRAPVVLCYLEGLTHEEAARQLHWPVGTVKGRLARAKDMLRGRLWRRGMMPSIGLIAATLARDATAAVPASLIQSTVRAALHVSAGRAAEGVVSVASIHLMKGVVSSMFATKLKVAAAVLGTCGCLALGGWAAAQQSRGTRTAPVSGRAEMTKVAVAPAASSAPATDDAREQALLEQLEKPVALKFQDTPLHEALKQIRAKTQTNNGTGLPIYVDPQGLTEAGVDMDAAVSIETRDVPLKASLDSILRPLKLGATTRDGLLVISSRQEITLIEVRRLNDELRRRSVLAKDSASRGVDRTESPAEWLKRLPKPPLVYHAGEALDDPSRATDERTRAILDKLRQPISMPFARETPLEEVIKYFKNATVSPHLPDGIPVYVDPIGLQEAEKTIDSPVTLSLEGVPLGRSLRLLLNPLNLTYVVKDGLMTITHQSSAEPRSPILQLAEQAEAGELSLQEMQDLVALFRTREQVKQYAFESSLNGSGSAGSVEGEPSKPGDAAAEPDTQDAARTQAIAAALNKVVSLKFDQTPLTNAIKDIQKLTAGPGLPEGIPIYLGRNIAASVVTIDLKGVRLRTALRLMLGDLGMRYTVKEGLLIIAESGSAEFQD